MATPHGLACFTITQAGASKDLTGFPCGIGIGDVVVRQFFALQLFVGGKAACGWVNIAVERGALVRVFAVAHVLHFNPALVELAREFADLGLARSRRRLKARSGSWKSCRRIGRYG